MKKLIYISAIAGLLLTSCSNSFLNLAPESSITDGNFYKTEDQFNQALIGAYASIRNVKGSRAAYVMGEMRSDNTTFEYNGTNRGGQYLNMELADEFLDVATSNIIPDMYNACYISISQINNILDNLKKVNLKQESVDQITGEAKFLRALCYFDLVRYFGGIPLYLNAVKNVDGAFLQRSSAEDVYKIIIDDLKDAIAKLSPPSFPQNGRATKGSARMLLADVYLTQKNYPLAQTELAAIMQMGYSLLPKYAQVFDLTNKNSIESIFEVQYQQGNQGQNSNFEYEFLPISDDLHLITGIPSNSHLIGGWNTPTQEMIDSYEPGDERLVASIGIAEGSGPVGQMAIESVKSPVGYITPAGKRSYIFIKKYLHPHSLENNTDDNFPVYRFADALLAMAEVLNEQNKPLEAQSYLNRVRIRANLDPITETNQVLLRDIIIHEQRIEFAFENKRWLDLVRTGKAIEVMTLNGQYLKSLYPILPANSYNVTTDRLIFPIPLREILIGKLEQNKGY